MRPSRHVIRAILLLGIVSLFAEMAYEGAHSISGQYLSSLGATGLIVGTIAGAGELISYSFRVLAVYLVDRTGQYWQLMFVGYIINLAAIPLLSFTEEWSTAALLMLFERFGKAMRTPPRDAILAFATQHLRLQGWASGLHKAMERVGGILGPIVATIILYRFSSYQMGFGLLFIPGLLSLSVLTYTRHLYPHPPHLAEADTSVNDKRLSSHSHWFYMCAIMCIGAGYLDFSLIAFHFERVEWFPSMVTPLFFAAAMAAASLSALVCGRLYDTWGLWIAIYITLVASFFSPFLFFGGFYGALLGVLLWGIGLGAHEPILRAFLAKLDQRITRQKGTFFRRILYPSFGVAWFLGSVSMGYLYDLSHLALVLFSCLIQLASIPFLLVARREIK